LTGKRERKGGWDIPSLNKMQLTGCYLFIYLYSIYEDTVN